MKICSQTTKMTTQLLDLPQLCLEEIFKQLSYSEISRVGAVCRYFREVAKTLFRSYFQRQEEVIEREMEKIETEANKSEKLTIDELLYLALLHSVLRILLSEAKMLKAHCWRYIKNTSYDFCFPAGRILDEFEKILGSIKEKSLNRDMEPEISTTLFHLGEKFYDFFDTEIETYFREPSDMKTKVSAPNEQMLSSSASQTARTLFGIKLIDILDCCATSDFQFLLNYDGEKKRFKIRSEYKLTDVNVLQALPSVSLSFSTVQVQLNKINRYVRNNVRWTNLFHPLQDLWMLEDAVEINRNVHTASSLLREWRLQRNASRINLSNMSNDTPQYSCRRIVSRFKNCFGLVVTADLECSCTEDMPLKLQKYIDFHIVNPQTLSTNLQNGKIEDQDITKLTAKKRNKDLFYAFHLELKIQYPSFLSDRIQEAILKVDQSGEETIITSNSEEVQKCATFRVEDENTDN